LTHPRLAVLLGALFALVAEASGGAGRPLRVMSIEACADQLVLALLPPEQITSVTWLSRDPGLSLMARQARGVGVNHGEAEEVLRDHPDLVVAGGYTSSATRAALRKLGYPLLELPPIDNFDDVRRSTLTVARAVGAEAKGAALVAQMDAVLRQLASSPAPRVRVAAWDSAQVSVQPSSMFDAELKAAGVRNVLGARAPAAEALLAAAPDLIVRGAPPDAPPGRRTDIADNPVVRRLWGDRIVVFAQVYYLCGTPFSAEGAARLRQALREAERRARSAPPRAAAAR